MTPVNPLHWPIRWQIALLLVFTQLVAHVMTVQMIDLSTAQRGGGRTELAIAAVEPMLTALRMTAAADPISANDALAELPQIDPRFRLEPNLADIAASPRRSLDVDCEAVFVESLPLFAISAHETV